MKREDLLKEMKESIGTQDPIVFFDKMVSVFTLLFDRIDELESKVDDVKNFSALAIQWDAVVALNMISSKIDFLRKDKNTYFEELNSLKKAYTENLVTQNYFEFTKFWVETLGYHPFLKY